MSMWQRNVVNGKARDEQMEKEETAGSISDLHNSMKKLLGLKNNCRCENCRIARECNSGGEE